MSKGAVMGTFTCQDGKAEEMEAVLDKMVEAAGGEPGVEPSLTAARASVAGDCPAEPDQ